jgi:hypothetical protein
VPLAPPEHTPIGARLRERTQPLAPDDAAYGYAHAYLCEAIGRMLAQLADVFDPDGDVPPLAPILDPVLCPTWALPWLAQFLGVQLPSGVSDAQARGMIQDVAGFKRGTVAAMRAVVLPLLTGTKTLWLRERNLGDAYALDVVTLTGETPSQAAVLSALLSQKPGGIVLTYRAVASWDYAQMGVEGGTYAFQSTQYLSYQKLSEHTKG